MTILIVDDEQPMRELVTRLLAPLGHTLLQAADAEAAITLLAQQPTAVVVCDRSMPGRDGDWLVEQVRAQHPSTAVILATADDAVPPRVSLQNGVIGYLVKPFNADQLRTAVADGISWHQAAAKSSKRQHAPLDGDAFDQFLRRAGRPEPKKGDA
jgi:DNA-binding NtrC family response regulator